MVEIAEKEGATGFAHGCTGRGNDQVRFDITVGALAPRPQDYCSNTRVEHDREEEIEYAKKNGIPVTTAAKKYSIDQSIWGRSIECGILEDASKEPPEDALNGRFARESS